MATTSTTTYRAVVEHGENGEFGKSYNRVRYTFDEADADAKRLEEILPADEFIRTVKVEQKVVTVTTSEVDWRCFP